MGFDLLPNLFYSFCCACIAWKLFPVQLTGLARVRQLSHNFRTAIMAADPSFTRNPPARITKPRIIHKQKSSPFDSTICSHFLPVGEHRLTSDDNLDHSVFTSTIITKKKDPRNPAGTIFSCLYSNLNLFWPYHTLQSPTQ